MYRNSVDALMLSRYYSLDIQMTAVFIVLVEKNQFWEERTWFWVQCLILKEICGVLTKRLTNFFSPRTRRYFLLIFWKHQKILRQNKKAQNASGTAFPQSECFHWFRKTYWLKKNTGESSDNVFTDQEIFCLIVKAKFEIASID